MDKFKVALDSLKKIASAKDEQEMFRLFSENKENFDTVQQRWFGHSRDTETVQVENEDYLQNIVRYVDIAISMYSKAIPHKSLLHAKENPRRKAVAHPRLQATIWKNSALAVMHSMNISLGQSGII